MPGNRMSRDEFYAKLSGLDEAQLHKALWTLYWRGSAQVRERIEAQLEPEQAATRRRDPEPPDGAAVLAEVRELATLARKGAYLGGDRRVSTRERSGWRFTFKRLVTEAREALRGEDLASAAAALEQLVDLACETREFDYFRSEDPISAAGVVVSDVVEDLWTALREARDVAELAARAAPQLARWESAYGWTRHGHGRVAQRERSLAAVLGAMLRAPDHWDAVATHYLAALDAITDGGAPTIQRTSRSADRGRSERAASLAEWHGLLVDHLVGSEAEGLLDRLATHAALGGPELRLVEARLAHARGEADRAEELIHGCLEELPGHDGFLDFAERVGAALPARAREHVVARRR